MWHVVLLHWGGRSLIRGAGEGLRTGWPQWRLSKAAKATFSVRESAFRLELPSMWRAQQEQWDAVAHWDAGLPDGGLRLSVFSQELLGSLGGCSESSAPAEPAAVTPCLPSAVALGTMSILWHAVPPGSSSMLFPPQWCCCAVLLPSWLEAILPAGVESANQNLLCNCTRTERMAQNYTHPTSSSSSPPSSPWSPAVPIWQSGGLGRSQKDLFQVVICHSQAQNVVSEQRKHHGLFWEVKLIAISAVHWKIITKLLII